MSPAMADEMQVPSASSGQALRLRAARFAQDDTLFLPEFLSELMLDHLAPVPMRCRLELE